MPYKGHVGLGVLWSLTPRQPPAPSCPLSLGFPGRRCQGGLAPTSEFSASDHNTNISFLPSVSVHLSVCLPRPSQPGLPPLLSLLLCVVPSKAVHLTYEPAWQLLPGEPPAAPTSTTSLSFSRQVMAGERGRPSALTTPGLTHTACAQGGQSVVSTPPPQLVAPCVFSPCACVCVRGGPAGPIFSFSSYRRQRVLLTRPWTRL